MTHISFQEEKFNNQNQGSSERYVYFEKSLDGTCKPYYDEWTRIVQNEGLDWMPSSFYFDHKDEMDFNTKYVSILYLPSNFLLIAFTSIAIHIKTYRNLST